MFSRYSDKVILALSAQWDALTGRGASFEELAQIIDADVCHAYVSEHESRALEASHIKVSGRFDAHFKASHRRQRGMYFTPIDWANMMASALLEWGPVGVSEQPWHVLDLSAGDGALLCAALRTRPDACALGVEVEPASALSAAMNLLSERRAQGWTPASGALHDRIILASGLDPEALPISQVACVLGNPPYLGEKGNKAFFEGLREEFPEQAHRIEARVDLLYLFLHRALDLLAPGGVMVHMTSAYWLQATGAAKLRRDLLERADPLLFWHKPGERLFKDAPGHHSLVTVWSRREARRSANQGEVLEALARSYTVEEAGAPGESSLAEAFALGLSCRVSDEPSGFRPFISSVVRDAARAFRAHSIPLSEVFDDRQGFVSGADRVTRAHAAMLADMEVGQPIFLFEGLEHVPDELIDWVGDLVRPVLRADQIAAGHVWTQIEHDSCAYALYVDGVLTGERLAVVETYLDPVRALLERRREVKMGRIPWYRMHWPRRREEQLGDKLVMARRGFGWCVCADLAGHLVSSDCTYLHLSRHGDLQARRRVLIRALIWFEQEEIWRDLEVYGKQKGELYEFYSEPLRHVPLPLCRDAQGEWVFDARVLGEARSARHEEETWSRWRENLDST